MPTIGAVPLTNDLTLRRTLSLPERPSPARLADAPPSLRILSHLHLWLSQPNQPPHSVPLLLPGGRRCDRDLSVMRLLSPSTVQGPPLLNPIRPRLLPLT